MKTWGISVIQSMLSFLVHVYIQHYIFVLSELPVYVM